MLLVMMVFESGTDLGVQVGQVYQVSLVLESALSYGLSRSPSFAHLSRSVGSLIRRLVGLEPVVQTTLGEVGRHVGWHLGSGSWLE